MFRHMYNGGVCRLVRMNTFIAAIGAKPLCPVHAHMVYFGSNRVYVLVRSLHTNLLPRLGTCVSVLAGGQRSTVKVEHYLMYHPSIVS